MKKINLHSHTTYCDGMNKTEEMIIAAMDKNFDVFGFSGHSFLTFDHSWCMSEENTEKYIAEVHSLASKYKNEITVLCGVEQDYLSTAPTYEYDYVIGSVHVIYKDNKYISVDYTAEYLIEQINQCYNGDALALAEDYFDLMGDVYNKTRCNIIGHFDLLTKFNEKTPIFDTNHPRYATAVDKALSKLLAEDVVFEVNTGAISRGYRTTPYPSQDIMKKIHKGGGKVIISTDTHSTSTVDSSFEETLEYIKACGFNKISAIDEEGNFYEEMI